MARLRRNTGPDHFLLPARAFSFALAGPEGAAALIAGLAGSQRAAILFWFLSIPAIFCCFSCGSSVSKRPLCGSGVLVPGCGARGGAAFVAEAREGAGPDAVGRRNPKPETLNPIEGLREGEGQAARGEGGRPRGAVPRAAKREIGGAEHFHCIC